MPLLAIIDKYSAPFNQWTWLYQELLEVSVNIIAFWTNVCAHDWTAKRTIIASTCDVAQKRKSRNSQISSENFKIPELSAGWYTLTFTTKCKLELLDILRKDRKVASELILFLVSVISCFYKFHSSNSSLWLVVKRQSPSVIHETRETSGMWWCCRKCYTIYFPLTPDGTHFKAFCFHCFVWLEDWKHFIHSGIKGTHLSQCIWKLTQADNHLVSLSWLECSHHNPGFALDYIFHTTQPCLFTKLLL